LCNDHYCRGHIRYSDEVEFFGISAKGDIFLPSWLTKPDPLTATTPDIVIRVDQDVELELAVSVTDGTKTMAGDTYKYTNSKEESQSSSFTATESITESLTFQLSSIPHQSGVTGKVEFVAEQEWKHSTSTTTGTKEDKTYFTTSEAFALS